jgi:hypothetical protein
MAFAAVTCAVDLPDDEIGKNRSGSENRQAAEERQCPSGGSSRVDPPLMLDIGSASATREPPTSSR